MSRYVALIRMLRWGVDAIQPKTVAPVEQRQIEQKLTTSLTALE